MEKGRLAVVHAGGPGRGARTGSGYVVAPRLVLTAGHVMGPENGPTSGAAPRLAVQPLGSPVALPCAVVWDGRARGLDAALLEVPADRWPHGLGGSPVRYGRLVTLHPGAEATAVGFARVQRNGTAPDARSGGLETTQVRGVVNPGDRLIGGRWVLTIGGTPPADLGPSPWGGMSGAALWCDRLLCGVITSDSAHWRHGKLEAVQAHRLLRDPELLRILRDRAGYVPVAEAVELAAFSESPLPGRPPQSPAELLRPQAEAVPFHGREERFGELRGWCQGEGLSTLLITGPGGQGKTRFVREFARRLAAEGWVTVQLRDSGAEDIWAGAHLEALASVHHRMLLVMDYAETRPGRVSEVLRALETRTAREPVRLLLIARSAGEWWEQMSGTAPRSAALLGGARSVDLGPLAETPRLRRQLYQAAVDGLARSLGTLDGYDGTDWATVARDLPARDITGPRLASALTLQMRALTDLLGAAGGGRQSAGAAGGVPARSGAPDPDVEAVLLAHEEGYWRRTAAQRPALAAVDPAALADAVALATLTRAADRARAVELLGLLPALRGAGPRVLQAAAGWLRDVYPAAEDSYWGSLEPDRLGEYHVAQRVAHDEVLLGAVLPHLSSAEAERALTVLARAAAQPVCPCPGLPGLVGRLIAAHPERLAPAAAAVAGRSENPEFLVRALSLLTRRDLPVAVLEDVHAAIPERSRLLGEEAVHIAGRLVAAHRRRALTAARLHPRTGSAVQADVARAQHNLALRLIAVRRTDEALTASSRSVRTYRALSRRDPERYLPSLAGSLGVHCIALAEQDRPQEALAVSAEAVRVSASIIEINSAGGRRTAWPGREADRLRLANALSNHSVALSEAKDPVEALRTSKEAVDILRELAQEQPGRHAAALARALHNLANRYAIGPYVSKQALEAITEAVLIRRRLALAQPDAHITDLADSLYNQALDVHNSGYPGDALKIMSESLPILLSLALQQPAVHRPRLARALATWSFLLRAAGRSREGAVAAARAVALYRTLITERPDEYAPYLAMAWRNLAESGLAAGAGAAWYMSCYTAAGRVLREKAEREHQRELYRTRWQRRRARVRAGWDAVGRWGRTRIRVEWHLRTERRPRIRIAVYRTDKRLFSARRWYTASATLMRPVRGVLWRVRRLRMRLRVGVRLRRPLVRRRNPEALTSQMESLLEVGTHAISEMPSAESLLEEMTRAISEVAPVVPEVEESLGDSSGRTGASAVVAARYADSRPGRRWGVRRRRRA